MEQVKKFIREHPHMWWGLYLPVYLTMFFIIEHLITDNYLSILIKTKFKLSICNNNTLA